MDKVVIADATMAAPISQATTLPTSGETVVYSKMNDYTVYTSATSGVVGYEDYDSTNNANINLTSMRFAGGTTVAGGILWFDFYSDRSMTNLVNYTGVQTPQSGDFVYTVTLGNAITIPDAGVLEISANTGTTGHWYGGSVAPSIGTNDSSYGGIHPNNYDFHSAIPPKAARRISLRINLRVGLTRLWSPIARGPIRTTRWTPQTRSMWTGP